MAVWKVGTGSTPSLAHVQPFAGGSRAFQFIGVGLAEGLRGQFAGVCRRPAGRLGLRGRRRQREPDEEAPDEW